MPSTGRVAVEAVNDDGDEVVSPSDRAGEVTEKALAWLDAGVGVFLPLVDLWSSSSRADP